MTHADAGSYTLDLRWAIRQTATILLQSLEATRDIPEVDVSPETDQEGLLARVRRDQRKIHLVAEDELTMMSDTRVTPGDNHIQAPARAIGSSDSSVELSSAGVVSPIGETGH